MDQGWKSYWAEFLGTFTLCFAGQGAILAHVMSGDPGSGLLAIATAHGLALAIMISAFGATSGGHMNPAVTFGFLVAGRQSLGSAARYWVAQLLGGLAASLLLARLFPASLGTTVRLGAPALDPEISAAAGFVIEAVLTFFLVTVVWGTAVDDRAPRIGGFGIGMAVLMGILMAGPLTGGAMNPARTLGPMIASGFYENAGLYVIAQLVGGGAAAIIYSRLSMARVATSRG